MSEDKKTYIALANLFKQYIQPVVSIAQVHRLCDGLLAMAEDASNAWDAESLAQDINDDLREQLKQAQARNAEQERLAALGAAVGGMPHNAALLRYIYEKGEEWYLYTDLEPQPDDYGQMLVGDSAMAVLAAQEVKP